MNTPRLIVGLGNPGERYRETRHNAGFMVVDDLAKTMGVSWRLEKKFFAAVGESRVAGRRLLLAKPQTFMNLSGEAVVQLVRFHRVELADLLVVVDDADLPLGTLRLRPEGSSGGHHGLQSIEQHLGGRGFARLKLGIARPIQDVRSIADHVLGSFQAEEMPFLAAVLTRAVQQVQCWATDGIAKAMNVFNGVVNPSQDGLKNAERKMQ